jgi:TatD DNase family protein
MVDLFDTHAHLDHPRFSGEVETVLQNARAAGVHRILSVASEGSGAGLRAPVELAVRHPMVWAAVGVHPHNAARVDAGLLHETATLAAGEKKVVAIGEIGLDYHYDFSPRAVQRDRLRDFLTLARAVNRPLVVHVREAHEDALRIFREMPTNGDRGRWRGVIHCFSGDSALADTYLELGFHLSLTGMLTFKKAETARRVAAHVPRERLMVETDAPYLAPVPHRGQRCEPAHVRKVAETLAVIWECDLTEAAAQTTRNGLELFSIVEP